MSKNNVLKFAGIKIRGAESTKYVVNLQNNHVSKCSRRSKCRHSSKCSHGSKCRHSSKCSHGSKCRHGSKLGDKNWFVCGIA